MKTDIDTNFSFDLPKNRSNVMKVMGIGGGGSNAVNYMYKPVSYTHLTLPTSVTV